MVGAVHIWMLAARSLAVHLPASNLAQHGQNADATEVTGFMSQRATDATQR